MAEIRAKISNTPEIGEFSVLITFGNAGGRYIEHTVAVGIMVIDPALVQWATDCMADLTTRINDYAAVVRQRDEAVELLTELRAFQTIDWAKLPNTAGAICAFLASVKGGDNAKESGR